MTRDEMEKALYGPLDAFLKRLKKKVKEVFAPLFVSGFDQLNVIQLNRQTAEMYSELDDFNRKEYKALANHAWEWAEKVAGKDIPKKDMTDLVNQYLKGYDPVTQYVYVKEVDRKRMRLNEAVLAAREYQDIVKLQKSVKKAVDLWFTQSSQYAIDIIEIAIATAFLTNNPSTWFMWNTQRDEKVCEECNELDGMVFSAKNYPPKPHYGCRCFRTPARKPE